MLSSPLLLLSTFSSLSSFFTDSRSLLPLPTRPQQDARRLRIQSSHRHLLLRLLFRTWSRTVGVRGEDRGQDRARERGKGVRVSVNDSSSFLGRRGWVWRLMLEALVMRAEEWRSNGLGLDGGREGKERWRVGLKLTRRSSVLFLFSFFGSKRPDGIPSSNPTDSRLRAFHLPLSSFPSSPPSLLCLYSLFLSLSN